MDSRTCIRTTYSVDIGLGNNWDVDRTSLYSGLLVLKAANWSLTYEVQAFGGGELTAGTLEPIGGTDFTGAEFEFDYAFDMAGRLEFYPSTMAQVSTIGLEAGWAQGDDGDTLLTIEGNALPFSPAYNVDNLLFKHVIPTIYNIEGSVINAIYARAYANVSLAENIGFTPQVLIAWNDETNAVSAFDSDYGNGNNLGPGISNTPVDDYLGTEIEGTLTWTLHPGVNLDFIGSLIIAGDGLTDLLEAKAGDGSTADDTIWGFNNRSGISGRFLGFMIAVDTNVLLRYLLNDDAAQADTAANLIKGSDTVLITDVVLAETLWTLSGKKYRLNKDQLAGVVHALFEEPNVRFEDGAAVWMALNDYLESDGADFADALIINKAQTVARAQGGPFSGSYTFDKAAQKLQGARTP